MIIDQNGLTPGGPPGPPGPAIMSPPDAAISIYIFYKILFYSPMYSIAIGNKYINPKHEPNHMIFFVKLVSIK